jgi:hypothetical protein
MGIKLGNKYKVIGHDKFYILKQSDETSVCLVDSVTGMQTPPVAVEDMNNIKISEWLTIAGGRGLEYMPDHIVPHARVEIRNADELFLTNVRVEDCTIYENKNCKFFAKEPGSDHFEFHLKGYTIAPTDILTKEQRELINDHMDRDMLMRLQADHSRWFTAQEFERLQELNKKLYAI